MDFTPECIFPNLNRLDGRSKWEQYNGPINRNMNMFRSDRCLSQMAEYKKHSHNTTCDTNCDPDNVNSGEFTKLKIWRDRADDTLRTFWLIAFYPCDQNKPPLDYGDPDVMSMWEDDQTCKTQKWVHEFEGRGWYLMDVDVNLYDLVMPQYHGVMTKELCSESFEPTPVHLLSAQKKCGVYILPKGALTRSMTGM